MLEPDPPRARTSFLTQPGMASAGRQLRPSSKVLPEHARAHNRALVLQTLFSAGQQSRADVARSTGLTRVTVSELVTELMAEGLLVETGLREGPRPGKPAILLDFDRSSFQVIGIDLSDFAVFRGAVLDLGGAILKRVELPLAGSTGQSALDHAATLTERLISLVSAPLFAVTIGQPASVRSSRTRLAHSFASPARYFNSSPVIWFPTFRRKYSKILSVTETFFPRISFKTFQR